VSDIRFGRPYVAKLTPPGDSGARMTLTLADSDEVPKPRADLLKLLHRSADKQSSQALGSSFEVHEFAADAPLPGGWWALTLRDATGEHHDLNAVAGLKRLVVLMSARSGADERLDAVALKILASAGLDEAAIPATPRPEEGRITVRRDGEFYALNVPASALGLRLPHEGWSLQRADNQNPRYFHFTDSAHGVNASGWIEPSARFSSVREMGLATAALSTSEFARQGDWDVVRTTLRLNAEATLRDWRAHRVSQGVWIEVHLSTPQGRTAEEQDALLAKALAAFEVVERR